MAKEIPKRVHSWHKLNPQQQMRRAWEEITKDFYLYCEKNLFITNKKGELVKLRPNVAQRKLVDAVVRDLYFGDPVRYIVLKARQLGLSTIIEALCYWWAATHKYVNAAIVAHEREAAGAIYQMFQRYYSYSDRAFKPVTKYYTKSDLTFDNEKGTGIKSQIKTMVATSAGTGRGQTNRFLHCSEVAMWDNGTEIVAGLMQTVPLMSDTFIFLESTANGVGGYFYDEWMLSKKNESIFKPFFFPWHEHNEYELNVPNTKFVFTPEEKELVQYFKSLGYEEKSWKRKLQWRRIKMKEFRSDPDKFMQEYPSTDMEAFIASGRPVFDTKVLIRMDRIAQATKFDCYAITGERRQNIKAVRVDDSALKVWELPQEGRRYVLGADVAEGKEVLSGEGRSGDYSVATVMDRDSRKTVARWRGHIDPDKFGDVICNLGWWYNEATVAIETNNQGLATVQRVRDKLYRRMYMREHGFDELFEEPTIKMGWRTDKSSKYIMISDLSKAIRDGDIIDYDQVFVRECMTYVRDENGRTNAQEGQYDDCVMSTAIALQLFDWKDIDRDPPKPSNPYKARIGERPRIAARHGVYKRTTKIR